MSLCCQGKSDYAEIKCKEVLNFKNAANIIGMSGDFWPLKIAVFEYIIASYFDSSDPSFMAKPPEEDEQDDTEKQEGVDESDVGILLMLIQILISDYDNYLKGDIKQTTLQYPNGRQVNMKELMDFYIYDTGFKFIKATLKRKKYAVGSVELKFYVLVKQCAECFYITNVRKYQLTGFDLL